jgi:uncharacterized DUF497 family protein
MRKLSAGGISEQVNLCNVGACQSSHLAQTLMQNLICAGPAPLPSESLKIAMMLGEMRDQKHHAVIFTIRSKDLRIVQRSARNPVNDRENA